MPNMIALAMLAIWPFVTLVIFKRLPVEKALIWAILLGYLFLPPPPAGFDFPLLPAFDKDSITGLSAFAMCFFLYGHRGSLLPETLLLRVIIAVFVLSPTFTVLTNGEPVFFGQVGIRGLGTTDIIALCLLQFMDLIPFLLARKFLVESEHQKEILKVFLITGLIYSLLMLIEVRMSPQVNTWVYGYFQHSFAQTVRFGGWRPIVFLYHGIWVALFALMVVLSGLALAKAETGKQKFRTYIATFYMLAVLILCKSMGSILFAILLVPMVFLLTRNMQVKVAAFIGSVAIAYPLLKGMGAIPVDAMLEQIASFSTERAGSLKFRFYNEDILLERALLKPIFGWGSWGRNHILNPVTGTIMTVTDGRWVIAIGVYGWVGFLAEFGLLTMPIFMVWHEARRSQGEALSPYVGVISLMLAINVFDMIPNATLTPLTWMFSGALLGYAEKVRADRKERTPGMGRFHWRTVM